MNAQTQLNRTTRPMSHGNDPSSSHAAAEQLVRYGIYPRQMDRVLEMLRLNPGATGEGLGIKLRREGQEKHEVVAMARRRLGNLRDAGLARSQPSVWGLIWYATEEGEHA